MAPIIALEAIEMLRILGLSARLDGERLFVWPAELVDDDVRWLVRTHKAEIIAALQNDAPACAWRIRFDDGTGKEIYRHPPTTRAEVLKAYPDAVSIERLPDAPSPVAPELYPDLEALVRAVAREYGLDQAELREALDAAARDPAGAWLSFQSMAKVLPGTYPQGSMRA